MRSDIIRITIDSDLGAVSVLMPGQQFPLVLNEKDWKEAKKTLTQKNYFISRHGKRNATNVV